MPGPIGPSRMTVGGTTSQPDARDTTYAATSRPASDPVGKSHSGRSPAIGLYTHAISVPVSGSPFPPFPLFAPCPLREPRTGVLIVQYKVAFDASTRRPSTCSGPWVSRSRTASSRSVPGAAPSSMAEAMAVLPRADVPVGIQRQPAQRAGRAPRGHDLGRPLGEGPRDARGDPDPQHPRPVGRHLIR